MNLIVKSEITIYTFLSVHGTDGVSETPIQEVEIGPVITGRRLDAGLPPVPQHDKEYKEIVVGRQDVVLVGLIKKRIIINHVGDRNSFLFLVIFQNLFF